MTDKRRVHCRSPVQAKLRLQVTTAIAADVPKPSDGQSQEERASHVQKHTHPSFLQGPQATRPSKWLVVVNELTRWMVAFVSLSFLIVGRHTVQVPLALMGFILNFFMCKALKVAINEQRPPSARVRDPGMPSVHAQCLGFLAVYFAVCCMTAGNAVSGTVLEPIASGATLATLALAIFMAWLRVYCGNHTAPQVLVGFFLGSSFVVMWYQLVLCALPAAQAHLELCMALKACTWLASAVLVARLLKKAPQQMHVLKQLQS